MIQFSYRTLFCNAVLSLFLMMSSSAVAVDWGVSGYGSLGYSYENEDDLGFLRNIAQPDDYRRDGSFLPDSNVGVQFDIQLNPEWSVTTQWVLEDRVEQSFNDVTELAFVRYLPDEHWDLRLGRLGLNAYTAADSRRIDYAYLWVRPPQELYGGIFYDSIDGVDITYRDHVDELNWSFGVQYGRIEQKLKNTENPEISSTRSNQTLALVLAADHGPWSGRLSYVNVGAMTVALGETSMQAQKAIQQLANAGLGAISSEAAVLYQQSNLENERIQYWQVGAGYADFKLTIQSELYAIQGSKAVVPEGFGGYVLAGYSFGMFTPYAIYGKFIPKNEPYQAQSDWGLSPINGAQLAAFQKVLVGGINSTYIDQSTYSFGLRWDVTSQMALKMQYDRVKIGDYGYGLWAVPMADISQGRDVQVFTLSLNFIF
ncbi:MAG: porin [Vibrio sp.]